MEVDGILTALNEGQLEQRVATDQLFTIVHSELRSAAAAILRKGQPNQTLQPTALVHEAYVRLIRGRNLRWESRAHFFGAAAHAMRQVLADVAREKQAQKRGGDWTRVSLSAGAIRLESSNHTVLELENALSALGKLKPRLSKVAEQRIFGGMTMREIALTQDISERTARTDWAFAKRWLRRELGPS